MQNKVIDSALALVHKINEQVRVIENCSVSREHVLAAELSLLLPDGAIAEIEGITSEQMGMVKLYITDMLDTNVKEAEDFLQSLQSKETPCKEESPTEPEVSEETKQKMKEAMEAEQARKAEEIEFPIKTLDEVQAEAQAVGMSYGQYMQKVESCTGATRKMTVGELEAELAAGLTISAIARKYGYSNASSIINAISKHEINVKALVEESPYRLTEEDIPQIRELYTEGSKNMSEAAAVLGVNKKIFKAFVDANHLTKKSK